MYVVFCFSHSVNFELVSTHKKYSCLIQQPVLNFFPRMIYRKIDVLVPKFQSRFYAILKNETPLRSKPRVPRISWEQWKPTNGNFDLPDPLRDRSDWSFIDPTSPTPLSKKLYEKKLFQLDLAKQIVNNLKEIRETEKLFDEELVERRQEEERAAALRPKAKGTLRI